MATEGYTGATVTLNEKRGCIVKALRHADDESIWCLTSFPTEVRWVALSQFDLVTMPEDGVTVSNYNKNIDVRSLLEQPISIRYLHYEFFEPSRTAFPAYLHCQNPVDAAYSVYVCSRCFSPMPTYRDLGTHEAFCQRSMPSRVPGTLIYHDPSTGIQVLFVDGAQHVQFSRNLAVLGAAFVEKDLTVDVDVTEFFVVTAPLAYIEHRGAVNSGDEAGGQQVVVGYFARYKQQPAHALSVILVLPFARKMGFGDLLLSVAFYLSEFRASTCGNASCCGDAYGKIDEPFSELGREAIYRFFGNRLLERGIPTAAEEAFTSGADVIRKCLGVHPQNGYKYLIHMNALHSSGRSAARRFYFEASPEIQALSQQPFRSSLFREENVVKRLDRSWFHYS